MNLTRTTGRLESFYQRYVYADSLAIKPESFDMSQYDRPTLIRGKRAWTLRTNDEYRSMVAFSELTHLCAKMQAPFDVIALASRLIRDEVRHVELCVQMTDLLGGRPSKAPQPKYVHTNPKQNIRRRTFHHVIGSCAIGETISVTMLAGTRNHTTDPVSKAMLTQMLKDESFHSRFGWLWMSHLDFTAEDRRWLDRFVPRVFGTLPSMTPKTTKEYVASPFGAIPHTERRDRLYEAIDEIIEAFEDHGLPGKRWWKERVEP